MCSMQSPLLDTPPWGMGKICHFLAKGPLHSWSLPSSEKHNHRLRRRRMPTKNHMEGMKLGTRRQSQERKVKVEECKRHTSNPQCDASLLYFTYSAQKSFKGPHDFWKWTLKLNLDASRLPHHHMENSLRAGLRQCLQAIAEFLDFLVSNRYQAFWELTGIQETKHSFSVFKVFTI